MRDVPWAVILAGGTGSRLQPLTRLLTGDDRPKQFCPLAGNKSLLMDTIERVATVADPVNHLYVVSKPHERFYRRDLASAEPWQILEQPVSRGTTAAIALSLASVATRSAHGDDPIVGFFPADHYYLDRSALRRGLTTAYAAASRTRDRIVLIGAQATAPETEYGWLQAGNPIVTPGASQRGVRPVREVMRFWEKPPADVAAGLLVQRWLWNTFITIGRLETFVSLLNEAVPDLWRRFALLGSFRGAPPHSRAIDTAYQAVAASDFSREILSNFADRLAVIELPARAGWTDLGQPGRALDLLARHKLRRPSLLAQSRLATAVTGPIPNA